MFWPNKYSQQSSHEATYIMMLQIYPLAQEKNTIYVKAVHHVSCWNFQPKDWQVFAKLLTFLHCISKIISSSTLLEHLLIKYVLNEETELSFHLSMCLRMSLDWPLFFSIFHNSGKLNSNLQSNKTYSQTESVQQKGSTSSESKPVIASSVCCWLRNALCLCLPVAAACPTSRSCAAALS